MKQKGDFLIKLAKLMEEYGASVITNAETPIAIDIGGIDIFNGHLNNTDDAVKELREQASKLIPQDGPETLGINTQLNYSPRLREIMAEINTIIHNADIAGYVVLHENGFSEYLLAIEPSWSIIKLNPPKIGLRSKLQEDFNGDVEAQHKATIATVNLIIHMLNNLKNHLKMFIRVYELLPNSWNITYGDETHTPHQPH